MEGWNLGRGRDSLAQTSLSCLAWVPARFLGGGESSNWVEPEHLGSLVKGEVGRAIQPPTCLSVQHKL